MLSVIIMTLNAQKTIEKQLRMLSDQTLEPDEILVFDSSSDDDTVSICRRFNSVRVKVIERSSFDHGLSRDLAFRESNGDIVIFMTQDAFPANIFSLEKLVGFLQSHAEIAAAYGRQLPREDSTLFEQYTRRFSYPPESCIYDKKEISMRGIKAFNLSDAFAAYRRDVYFELGGFIGPVKTNEDMFFAATALRNGYGIGYAAEAEVIHSHDFTLRQQFNRYYLIGYELEKHKELLLHASSSQEGKRLVLNVSGHLLKGLHFIVFIRFGLDCAARMLGKWMGRRKRIKENKDAE